MSEIKLYYTEKRPLSELLSLANLPKKPQLKAVERRTATRYRVDFPCRVTTAEMVTVPGLISDLSLSGLQMQGDTAFVHTLYPNFKRQDWRTPIKVQIDFSVPTTRKESTAVSMTCQLVYCRRMQEQVFKIGCQYLEINSQAQETLEDHIKTFGVPKSI